jgi:hypothetical protein
VRAIASLLWWLGGLPVFAYSTLEHTLEVTTPEQWAAAIGIDTICVGLYLVRLAVRWG